MKKASLILILPLLLAISSTVYAKTVVEEFKIEGLISPASPKALKSALEEKLKVKVTDLNIKNTETGWPVIRVQFDVSLFPFTKRSRTTILSQPNQPIFTPLPQSRAQ